MFYAIICTDKPDHGHVRAENRPAHLEFLANAGDMVKVGGAMLTEDGTGMTGSLLIVEGESLQAVREWAAEDPFNKAGLFEAVIVRPWRFAVGSGLVK